MAYELTTPSDLALVRAALGMREPLSANRTYYVRSNGSDSNDGLTNTAGGAFLTLQKAYDTIVQKIDLAGYTVTIQVGAVATFTAGIQTAQPWTGGGSLTIDGGGGTINAAAVGCLVNTATLPGVVTLQNVTVTTSADLTLVQNNGVGAIRFGTGFTFGSAGLADHVSTGGAGAQIIFANAYTITGGGRYHILNVGMNRVTCVNQTVTLTGTPAFASGFVGVQGGSVLCYGNTYSGSATGSRYVADRLGLIDARGGASYLPGNAVGSTSNGGVYV